LHKRGDLDIATRAAALATPVAATIGTAEGAVTLQTAAAMAQEMQALGVEHFFLMTGRDNRLWIALEAAGIRVAETPSQIPALLREAGYRD